MKKEKKKETDKSEELRVFVSYKESACNECKEKVEKRDLIVFTEKNEILCLTCADLDHLVYLPAGDAALTRRARKHSTLSAIVYRFSKARKRNERQGVLAELQALEKAEVECLEDAEIRAVRRERDAERREKLDKQYIENFTNRIMQLFPECPQKVAGSIANHACLKYSGRVGRTAEAKKLSDKMIELAVIAHIRHSETPYDSLLADYRNRRVARKMVQEKINEVYSKWQGKINKPK